RLPQDGELDGEILAHLRRRNVHGGGVGFPDMAVGEHARVELGRLAGLAAVEPQADGHLAHRRSRSLPPVKVSPDSGIGTIYRQEVNACTVRFRDWAIPPGQAVVNEDSASNRHRPPESARTGAIGEGAQPWWTARDPDLTLWPPGPLTPWPP